VQCVAVAAAGAMALTACSSSSNSKGNANKAGSKLAANYSYGSIPAESTTSTTGGTVTFGETPGFNPNWILPVTPLANSSVFNIDQFQYLSYRPLYWSPQGATPTYDYSKSLTNSAPVVSNGGKTFTVTLNGQYTWSDGHKVTANDVLFDVDVLQAAVKESPANDGNFTVGQFPQNLTDVKVVNPETISFTFNQVYNPAWIQAVELDQIDPLPSTTWAKSSTNGPQLDYTKPANAKAIYDYLVTQAKSLSTYSTNPLWQDVDGPYKMTMYNATSNAVNFTKNPAYTGSDPSKIQNFDEKSYTTTTAEFDDMKAGNLDVFNVDSSQVSQLPALKAQGFATYGLPDFGFNDVAFNFDDKTNDFNNIVDKQYFREVVAYAQDQEGEIKGPFQGAAAPQYSSVGVAPVSPYTPAVALTNPYPFSLASAKQQLTSHGWTVGNATTPTTCTDPGTGANQCGVGIAKGQNISFTYYYGNDPKATGQIATSLASNLDSIGVKVNLDEDTDQNVEANASVVSDPKFDNKWGMSQFGGETNGIYPSTNNLFNTGGSYNSGGYSDPTMDALIKADYASSDPTALTKELAAVTKNLPVLFTASPDYVYAWKNTLSGPATSFQAMTQFQIEPEEWFLTKQ
jgi:peptide/nickel transport system substrate-binding protein